MKFQSKSHLTAFPDDEKDENAQFSFSYQNQIYSSSSTNSFSSSLSTNQHNFDQILDYFLFKMIKFEDEKLIRSGGN